jgi:hypothetical protein
MYYIGLDVHKKTISYCVKDAAGHVTGTIGCKNGKKGGGDLHDREAAQ